MAKWNEPKNDYTAENQVKPEIFNTLAENEKFLQEKKITTEQVQDATVTSTQSTSRETLGDKETVKGFFGKIRKWFANLRALAFKGTVGTADIDNYAITSAKIASSAITNAKISSVSASKVTGLHKVATSGNYNDLLNKPNIGGGGVQLTKYVFDFRQSYDVVPGIFLCFVRYWNRASIPCVACCGLLTTTSYDNGAYSGVSSVYDNGDYVKIQVECSVYNGKMSFKMLESTDADGSKAPNDSGYLDGGGDIILFKLGDIPSVDGER